MAITNIEKIFEAYDLAKSIHQDQKRKTGGPYIIHPIKVAQIALNYGADDDIIIACLLHDTVEDHPDKIEFKEIEEKFGPKVKHLVEGVTKEENSQKTIEKVKIFAEKDPRVALVKLADRIHNTLTLPEGKEHEGIKVRYKQTNPQYIEIGEKYGYKDIAEELRRLTEKIRIE